MLSEIIIQNMTAMLLLYHKQATETLLCSGTSLIFKNETLQMSKHSMPPLPDSAS